MNKRLPKTSKRGTAMKSVAGNTGGRNFAGGSKTGRNVATTFDTAVSMKASTPIRY